MRPPNETSKYTKSFHKSTTKPQRGWVNPRNKVFLVCLVVFLASVAGWAVVSLSLRADTSTTASFQAEAGTRSGGITQITDTNAAGGSAIQFGAVASGDDHRFPYSFTDTQFFSGVTTAAPFRIGCETRSNLSVVAHAEPASVINNCGAGTSTINRVRLGGDLGANGSVREGYRCSGSGTMNIQNSWLEAKGTGDDHADVLQCYDPNNSPTATLNISNTTIRGYNTAATAGLFVADAYAVDVHLDDVLFWGAPYGLRIHTDGRPGKLYANNVCFYGTSSSSHSFGTGPILINPYPPTIVEWNNVNWCTIENGALVIHGAIAKP
jgi:hypothetical protein